MNDQNVTPLPEPQDFRGRGRLEGHVAVVTGSDSGIGQATAIEFAVEGADVTVTYLHDQAGAEHTRAQVEAQRRRARLAVYMASSHADYATGTTFTLDDGLMQNQGLGA